MHSLTKEINRSLPRGCGITLWRPRRRMFHISLAPKSRIEAWYMTKYDSYTGLTRGSLQTPLLGPDEVLIKVKAASVNPLDLEMARGYGKTLLNSLRTMQGIEEFPLVLGRDCSGTIVKRGRKVRRFDVGDEVWCSRWVIGQGTHATFVPVKVNEVARKPKNLTFEEAASIPFVACTVWPSLVSRAGLSSSKPGRRVLILGASGGVGSFAVQLARHMQANVSATAREEYNTILKTFGASEIFDYQDEHHLDILEEVKPFDIIFDCRGGPQDNKYHPFLVNNLTSSYISLMPPILPYTDEKGFAMGIAGSAFDFLKSNRGNICEKQGIHNWGFFFPNGGILEQVRVLVEQGAICPLIDSIYSFSHVKEAYERLVHGGVKGKVVVTMRNENFTDESK